MRVLFDFFINIARWACYDATYPTPLQWVITVGEHKC